MGRKFEQDYVAQAIRTAMAVSKPVNMTWPWEVDMAHDQYSSIMLSRIQVGLDVSGNTTAWANRQISSSIPAGHARGIAFLIAFGSLVAEVKRRVNYPWLKHRGLRRSVCRYSCIQTVRLWQADTAPRNRMFIAA